MQRKALSEKIIVLGVDGMDPRLTKKYLDQGIMPNLQKYLAQGSAREDLVLLGGVPTITPPMWTTLSTGTYPNTHGITCFWSQHPEKLDTFVYANDSKNCQAEQLWDVFAEAGKKTLVWHWPGCSWPPTSESENLHVIEGTQPSAINYGIGVIDKAHLLYIDEKYVQTQEHEFEGVKMNGAGCIVDGMEVEDDAGDAGDVMKSLSMPEPRPISMNPFEGECHNFDNRVPFYVEVPLKEAKGWAMEREGDKEFALMFCEGRERRLGLFRKNAEGIYDTVELYHTKKDTTPMAVLKNNDYVETIFDELLDAHDHKVKATRSVIAADMDPTGTGLKLWVGNANKVDCNALFAPHRLYNEVIERAGYIPSVELGNNLGGVPHLLEAFMHRSWRAYGDWQARAINQLIEAEDYEIVFSHYHNIDNFGHTFYDYHNTFGDAVLNAEYERLFQELYKDTDRYLGDFLPLLDNGWTVIITSDHGLLCKEEPGICPGIGDGFVINTTIMRQLGYTVMKRDENGKELREIDYTKTKAVASRGNHIYLNLKSRYDYGIVSDEEQYELERQIISDLYNYRNEEGKRIIGLAIRNQEGALLGLSGDKCGDILYWLEEGFNRVHGDSLSTLKGYADTSVSPIFIAAGAGVKHGYYTNRVIRQVDVAPTMAVLGGVRMPRECEGAVVYQILAEEF